MFQISRREREAPIIKNLTNDCMLETKYATKVTTQVRHALLLSNCVFTKQSIFHQLVIHSFVCAECMYGLKCVCF